MNDAAPSLKTKLSKLKDIRTGPKATADQIDRTAGMPSREATAAQPIGKKVKSESQVGIRGDSEIIQRFSDYTASTGLTYAEALKKLMDEAEVP